jgi:hypothetical protein
MGFLLRLTGWLMFWVGLSIMVDPEMSTLQTFFVSMLLCGGLDLFIQGSKDQ